jgi:hypothetical protein
MMVMTAAIALTLASGVPGLGLGLLPQPAGPEQWYAGNACILCHRERGGRLAEIVDREWAAGVHYGNNVPCESCHGGDPSLTRDQFSSDDEFTKASHLSFRPEFLFLRDRIGIGMSQETTDSFACRECHGQSIERPRGDPHAGGEVRPCLFSRDGGVSMTRGRSIAYVCAKCHSRATEKHLASPHGSFGVPSCLFCHGEGRHSIPKAAFDILDPRPRDELGRCSPCHKPGSMNVVAQIRETFEHTDESMEVAGQQFQELQRMGYRNLILSEMHAHLDDTKARLREIQHGCNIREIKETAKAIEHVAKHTAYDHELVLVLNAARQRQTKAALGTAGLLLVLVIMLALYKRAFCDHSDRAAASISEAASKNP